MKDLLSGIETRGAIERKPESKLSSKGNTYPGPKPNCVPQQTFVCLFVCLGHTQGIWKFPD